MNIGELLSYGYNQLKNASIETYKLDAQLLLAKVLNKDRLFIITNRNFETEAEDFEEYTRIVGLREKKMPVKYILGECEFMDINFYIKEGVLIPRPDTEVLVEDSIEAIKKYDYKIIADVCCGSGIIGLSIAQYLKNTKVSLYDISDTAIEVTKENIHRLDLYNRAEVYKSDLLNKAVESNIKFDVILSNPPYIKKEVIPSLMEDVKNYEPYIALCGGEDGLDFYRKIIKQAEALLSDNGMIAFEIGYDQKEAVSSLLISAGFKDIVCIKDFGGHDRVVKGFYSYNE